MILISIIAVIGIIEAIIIKVLLKKLSTETKQTNYTLELLTDALSALKTIKDEKEIPIYSYFTKIEDFSISNALKDGKEFKCLSVRCKKVKQ